MSFFFQVVVFVEFVEKLDRELKLIPFPCLGVVMSFLLDRCFHRQTYRRERSNREEQHDSFVLVDGLLTAQTKEETITLGNKRTQITYDVLLEHLFNICLKHA